MKVLRSLVMYISLLGLLAGCLAQVSTPSNYFLLTALSPATETLLASPPSCPAVGVSQAVVPAFLDRPQLVTHRSPNQIEYAEFNRWAEPLEDGVTRVLRENLGRLLAPEKVYAFPWSRNMQLDYEVHTVISQFTANLQAEQVVLVVFWRITRPDGNTTLIAEEKVYTAEMQGGRPHYSQIAQSMSATIAHLSEDIAAAVLRLQGAGSGVAED